MTIHKNLRASVSGLLSLSLVAALSLGSFAASAGSDVIDESIFDSILVGQAPTGTLTAKGRVAINGNPAQTGATVLSGSLIVTGGNSHATIEMASLGRVDVHDLTEITLTPSGNEVRITLHRCGAVTTTVPGGVTGIVKIIQRGDHHVKVSRGQVTVKYGQGKEKIVKAGENKEFDDATEVIAAGDAVFKVYCGEDRPLLALLVLPAALLLIERGGDEEDVIPPILSPLAP
jgi:hypothetical protein